MGKLTTPFVLRDFHLGRYSPENTGDFLCPENSVSECVNVNFDTILGQIEARGGQQSIPANSATDAIEDTAIFSANVFRILGGFIFKTATLDVFLAGALNSVDGNVIYYDNLLGDRKWHKSDYAFADLSADQLRFAQLNGHVFVCQKGVGSTRPMYESANAATWTKNGNCIPESIKPTLVYRFQGRLLAAGDPAYPSRIWVSSVVDLNGTPFITWNIDPIDGDWIDVNPDDGGQITGFAEASTFLLIFKDTGMYRTDDITSTVTPDNIFNVGAVSQEAITTCQGVVYYYSGKDVRSTDGGYPQIISRAGVQDVVQDASNMVNGQPYFSMGSDQVNVWLLLDSSLGTVVKYSTRDQSWTYHQYYNYPVQIFVPTSSYDVSPIAAICVDSVHAHAYWMAMEIGNTDGSFGLTTEGTEQGLAYDFSAVTQDLEFGSRAHWKVISDKIIVYATSADGTEITIANQDAALFATVALTKAINIIQDVKLGGFLFYFQWSGSTDPTNDLLPIFEGLEIEEITDTGVNYG